MAWRDKFQIENLQQIIDQAINKLYNDIDEVKKNRINEILQEATKDKNGNIDLSLQEKNLYSTVEQAKHFVSISTELQLKGLEKILNTHKEKFNQTQEIIDYGCGNAVKGAWIYHLLEELSPSSQQNRILRLFDSNDHILTVAKEVAEELGINPVKSEPPLDIEDHFIKKRNNNRRLHLFLGQTIGNFKDPRPVIENLAKSMRKGEYLIVEWLDRDPSEYEQGKVGERTLEFLYRYFEEFGIPREYLSTNNGHFMRSEKTSKGFWNIGYLILNNHFTYKNDSNGNEITLEPGTNLIGLRSCRFQDNELPDIFEKYGLEAVVFEKNTETIDMGSRGVRWITHKRKYDPPEGDKRYAIFKKVKEPLSRLKSVLISVVLAAGIGIAAGGYYFGEKVIECENPVIENYAIECNTSNGKNILSIGSIEQLKFGSEKKLGYETTFLVKGLLYSTKVSWNQREKLKIYLENKKKAENILKITKYTLCLKLIDLFENENETLAYIGSCTHDLSSMLRMMDFIEKYNQSGIHKSEKRVVAKIAEQAYKTHNGIETIELINQFTNKQIIELLKEAEKRNQSGDLLVDFLFPFFQQKDQRVTDAVIDLARYYVSTNNFARYDWDQVMFYEGKQRLAPSKGVSVLQSIKTSSESLSSDVLVKYVNLAKDLKDKEYGPLILGFLSRTAFLVTHTEDEFVNNSNRQMFSSVIEAVDKYKDSHMLHDIISSMDEIFKNGKNPLDGSNHLFFFADILKQDCVYHQMGDYYGDRRVYLLYLKLTTALAQNNEAIALGYGNKEFLYKTGICLPDDTSPLDTITTELLKRDPLKKLDLLGNIKNNNLRNKRGDRLDDLME